MSVSRVVRILPVLVGDRLVEAVISGSSCDGEWI